MINRAVVISYTKVFSADGDPHNDIVVGEAIDWNIPSAQLAPPPPEGTLIPKGDPRANSGGFNDGLNLVYQQGLGDDSHRFGGVAFIEDSFNGGPPAPVPFAAAVLKNLTTRDPSYGFLETPLWNEMTTSGFRAVDAEDDLHTLMTFNPDVDLDPDDIYEAVCIMATVREGTIQDLEDAIDWGKNWYTAKKNELGNIFLDGDDNGRIDLCQGCCNLMGDIDHNGVVNGMDAVYFVNWLWNDGPEPPCMDEVNIDGLGGVTGMDVVYLVNYLWNDGPDPVPCP
jgi:hypothetical protein